MYDVAVSKCCGERELRAEKSQYEDTRRMFTRGAKSAQVVVGVKKNRPR